MSHAQSGPLEPAPEEAGSSDADPWSLRLTLEGLARSEVVLRISSGALLFCRASDASVLCALTMGAEAAGVFVRSERGALAVQVRRLPPAK